jgi:hypothetical protein
VFDIEQGPPGFEDQLNRIEAMLLRLQPTSPSQETLHGAATLNKPQAETRSMDTVAPVEPPSQSHLVATPVVAHAVPLDDPRYSAATIVDANGQTPVYR